MDQDCFSFFKYELLSDLLKRVKPLQDELDILEDSERNTEYICIVRLESRIIQIWK